MSNERLLTIKDVAKRLAISTSLAYDLVHKEKILPTRVGNGRGTIRVTEEALKQYIERQTVVLPAPTVNRQTARQKLEHLQPKKG